MQLFSLNEEGSNLEQIIFEEGTHWSPYPDPDGVHVLYVKIFTKRNLEIVLLNLQTIEKKR
jgi:Tol biopolymer transport system component